MSSLSKEQVFYNLENPVTENLQVGKGVLLNQSSQDKVCDKEENKLDILEIRNTSGKDFRKVYRFC